MSLEYLRRSVDDVDARLVRLLAERLKLSSEIGKEKTRLGKSLTDASREAVVMERIRKLAADEGIDASAVESVYRRIIAASKGVQGISVAFQGEPGAYSQQAAFNFFGAAIETKPCETLEDVFSAVERGEAGFAVVPVENSLEGSISKTYDLLLESPLKVCGELNLRVSHCLIASPGASLAQIKSVYSHPQALGQCQAFLKHLGCHTIPTLDTAGSVKMIKEKKLLDAAAVASSRSASIYDMRILASGIEDTTNNFTRFFVLSGEDSPPTGNDKTSLVFSVKDRPGSLFDFLRELADRKINLTKIESRPTRRKPWEYNFYLDFEGHRLDKGVAEVLKALEAHVIFLKVLGSYPKAATETGEQS
ncbi:MAG: prephenate dehydratase [Dehalococcoidia bacterium]|nr:MAG: prephenate dehydratase [Dehalococcoidia bacterium]